MSIRLYTCVGSVALLGVILFMPLRSDAQEAPESAPVAPPVGGPAEERAGPNLLPPTIAVSEVRQQLLRDRVFASGLVGAVEEVQVQPLVEAQPIVELLADVGDTVQEGQVLARLSPSSLRLQLSQLAANRASAEAQIAEALAELTQASTQAQEAENAASRTGELAETGSVPRVQAEQEWATARAARAGVLVVEQAIISARAQLDVVDAQVALAELQLSRTEVRAPVSGLVVERNARLGTIAAATDRAMFTLVRDGAMELRAEVSEQDLLRLAAGQIASLSITGGSEGLPGIVRLVEPFIDPVSRHGLAHIEIDGLGELTSGTFLTVEILITEQTSLAVPLSAVTVEAEGTTVMIVRDGAVERVPVITGVRDGALIGITEGLSEGDQVVTKSAVFVRDGDRVIAVLD